MRILKALIIAFIILDLLFFHLNKTLAQDGSTLFYDDFSKDLSLWNINSGTWIIDSGNLLATTTGQVNFLGEIDSKSTEWDNYTFELDVNNISGVDEGIEFRKKDSGNAYTFNLRHGTGLHNTPEIKFFKTQNNTVNLVSSFKNTQLSNNIWYHIKIEVLNEKIKLFINNNLVYEYLDESDPIRKGGIGLQSWTGTIGSIQVRFDNIKVETLTPIQVKTPLILVPGIAASFNWGIIRDRGNTGWGWTTTAESGWKQFIDSLEKAGYQKDKDYFVSFYDWRKTVEWSDTEISIPAKYLVETIYKAKLANPGITKVNIIAHSFGGLVTRSYVESPYYREDINKAFLIGSPNAGSTFAYYPWEGGQIPPNWDPISKSMLNIFLTTFSFIFQEDTYHVIHDHIKSIKNLLPIGYDYLVKETTPISWLEMHEVNNFLKSTANLQNTAKIFTDKGVQLFNITGTGKPTWEKIKIESFIDAYLWKDGKPLGALSTADGDNTVLKSSSFLPEVEQLTVVSKHGNLPNAATPLIFEKLSIPYTPSTLAGAPDEIMVAWVASPVTLTVKDSQGNIIGETLTDPEGEKKWVFIKNPTGDYKIDLQGTGSGEYHMGVDYYTDTKTESIQTQGQAVLGANLNYDLNFDPESTKPLNLEPIDKVAPVTDIQLEGKSGENNWYWSDIDISLSSTDNIDGTGVSKTEYSFDNKNWQKYTTPLKIDKEGITTIYYRSLDLVGNIEQTKQSNIKIDKTPPETYLIFNPESKKIELKGQDNLTETVQTLVDNKFFTLKDISGHTIKIELKNDRDDNVSIESISYDSNPPIQQEKNNLKVDFKLNKKDNMIEELKQKVMIKDDVKIDAEYNKKNNQTKLILKEKGQEKQKITQEGLILLKLRTNKGVLEAGY